MGPLRTEIIFAVHGMTCENCPKRITAALLAAPGVRSAAVSLERGTVKVAYDADCITEQEVIGILEGLGYRASRAGAALPSAVRTAVLLAVILGLYFLVQKTGLLNLLVPARLAESGMSYAALFLIGLLTSVHCIAMCGGIGLAQCLPRAEQAPEVGMLRTLRPAVLYNLGRVVSYTGVGAVLGLAGMALGVGAGTVSPLLQGGLKILAGALMVVMGINMLGAVPWLRRFHPRLPGLLTAPLERAKAAGHGPLLVGLLNGLMPCGPLQAMQIAALASGSPAAGALSMLAFSLGTVPLMLGLGSLVSVLGRRFARQVMGAGAVFVAVLGLAMAAQGAGLAGLAARAMSRMFVLLAVLAILSVLPLRSRKAKAALMTAAALLVLGFAGLQAMDAAGRTAVFADGAPAAVQDEAAAENGVQVIRSTLSAREYPSITVQQGVPVRWIIDAPAGSVNGCNYRMMLSPFGRQIDLHEGENIVEFTPEQSGSYEYSCWMGMLRGNVTVMGTDGSVPAQAGAAPSAPVQGGCPMCAAAPFPAAG